MKRMKKSLWLLAVLIFSLTLMTLPAFAKERMPRLTDAAGLLTGSEQEKLQEELDEISEREKFDIAVLTVSTLNGKVLRDYADDFYEENGYGYGAEADGVLLLLDMEEREWWISTCGYGMTAITDAGINYISNKILPDLKDGDYAEAFHRYAVLCEEFVRQAKSGQPYDGDHMPKEPFAVKVWLPLALVIGIGAAWIATGSMKKELKSVKKQSAAANYMRANSRQISESRDFFLYNTLERTEKTTSSGSSSGSSTHTSSSGQTHGGGGGKF